MILLNVRIDEDTREDALQKVHDFLSSNTPRIIFTPNPEMLVAAYHQPHFRDILNAADVNICDGKGIALASRGAVERIPGTDFMIDVCRIAEEMGRTVYLCGSGFDTVVKKTADNLKKQFPKLQIVGTHRGPTLQLEKRENHHVLIPNQEENEQVLHDIILAAPDILFVAFGHEKQERWIYEHLPMLPSVKIAMGVGGAFDFISGKIRRAPRFLRVLGLEWMWRLIQEPRRWRRIWRAVMVFPFLYLKDKRSSKL